MYFKGHNSSKFMIGEWLPALQRSHDLSYRHGKRSHFTKAEWPQRKTSLSASF